MILPISVRDRTGGFAWAIVAVLATWRSPHRQMIACTTKIISTQIGTDRAIPVATPRATAALSMSRCAISGSASVVIVADIGKHLTC